MVLYLTERLSEVPTLPIDLTLSLTAEERTRCRHYFETEAGQGIHLALSRGTVLRHGEVLRSQDGKTLVQVIAKPEPVITVSAPTPLALLRAAYHLGNRHVPLEITPTYLRLSPDSVLQSMLEHLGMQVTAAVLPFEPETGAYGSQAHHHPASESHSHPELSSPSC